jgi:predicted AlkP superfamily phosphohydrolase/phosphomutase
MTVVVLGLDGFHHDLLQYTPNLAKRYEQMGGSTLKSTTPPVTAPAWSSFQTGVNQGKHGIFDFVKYTDTFEMNLLDGRDLDSKTVYEWLDEAGYDCYLQNLPFALPPRIEGDIMPSWLDGDNTASVPPDLPSKYGVSRPTYPELDVETEEKLERLSQSFETNASIFKSVLSHEDHDFYFHLISVTDWLQHAAYQELIEEPTSKIAESTRELLSDVDAYVERIFEMVSDDTDVILLSDHGFRLYEGSFFVNDWLEQMGYLKCSPDGHRFSTKNERNETVVEAGRVGQWMRRRSFWPLLRPVKNWITNLPSISVTAEKRIDLERSLAYCRSKDEKSIRFNREHSDFDESLVETLKKELGDVEYVDAFLANQLYSGPHTDEAGEIVLKDVSHLVNRGPIGETTTNDTIAHHDESGIFVASGPSFDGTPESPDLFDITPTILHRFGLPIPERLDGRVLEEILVDDDPIEYIEASHDSISFHESDRSDGEVKNRLEDLGYL